MVSTSLALVFVLVGPMHVLGFWSQSGQDLLSSNSGTSCAATTCFKDQDCYVFRRKEQFSPRCIDPKKLPSDAGSERCGSSGRTVLFEKRRGIFVVFRPRKGCLHPNLVRRQDVCCFDTEKVGQCPPDSVPTPRRRCGRPCNGDNFCEGTQKCCTSGACPICRQPVTNRTCAVVKCDALEQCEVINGNPVCVPISNPDKPGDCPASRPGQATSCLVNCSSDDACPGNEKCCSVGCSRQCVAPVINRSCDTRCNFGEKCELQDIVCITQPCLPVPTCVPDLSGQCPPPARGRCGSGNFTTCSSFRQCSSDYECCDNGCGRRVCVRVRGSTQPPQPPQPILPPPPFPILPITCANVLCIFGTNCLNTRKGPRCLLQKPGICAIPGCIAPIKRCTDECQEDNGCPGRQKCCQSCGCNKCQFPGLPDTCNSVICKRNEECLLQPVQCGSRACQPVPSCVPIGSRQGVCPTAEVHRGSTCPAECRVDNDCSEGEKCCTNGCGGKSCVLPLTVFCCTDVTCGFGQECREIVLNGSSIAHPQCYDTSEVPRSPSDASCSNTKPLLELSESRNLNHIFCGRGTSRKQCPRGFLCHVIRRQPSAQCCKDVDFPCRPQCSRGELCEKMECTNPPCPTRCVVGDECQLLPSRGPCKALLTRYYYCPKEKTCKNFTYGGCDGNENNFATFGECLRICGPRECPLIRCSEPCKFGFAKDENDCNTCSCLPPPQSDLCPPPSGLGLCVEKCTNTSGCAPNQVCCFNGCGHTCFNPVLTCADITCNDGFTCDDSSGEPVCKSNFNSGSCPPVLCASPPFPRCRNRCLNDFDCPGRNQKCCSGCADCKLCLNAIIRTCGNMVCGPNEECRLQPARCSNLRCDRLASCVRRDCPKMMTCADGCPFGHAKDDNDCPICKCLPPPTPPGSQCPPPKGLLTCADECLSDANCTFNTICCPNGCGKSCVKPDGPGPEPIRACSTVDCAPGFKCAEIDGKAECLLQKGGDCPLFPCPRPIFPPPKCRVQECNDEDSPCPGNQRCCRDCNQCRVCLDPLPDPCQRVTCGFNEECRLQPVHCDREPCSRQPVPTCVKRGSRHGVCPTARPPKGNNCTSSCTDDSDCSRGDKCCATLCGAKACTKPIPISCCDDVRCNGNGECREVLPDGSDTTVPRCFSDPFFEIPRGSNDSECADRKPLIQMSGAGALKIAFCGRGPSRIQCPHGYSCRISPVDRFAFCCKERGPICKPPCGPGAVCQTSPINCFVEPCPPTPRCEEKPAPGCQPPCRTGQKCILETVRCLIPPCPRVPKCVPKLCRVCFIFCEHGMFTGPDGCPTCSCRPAPITAGPPLPPPPQPEPPTSQPEPPSPTGGRDRCFKSRPRQCRKGRKQWFFDLASLQCRSISACAGALAGNEGNLFKTKEDCMETCNSVSCPMEGQSCRRRRSRSNRCKGTKCATGSLCCLDKHCNPECIPYNDL